VAAAIKGPPTRECRLPSPHGPAGVTIIALAVVPSKIRLLSTFNDGCFCVLKAVLFLCRLLVCHLHRLECHIPVVVTKPGDVPLPLIDAAAIDSPCPLCHVGSDHSREGFVRRWQNARGTRPASAITFSWRALLSEAWDGYLIVLS